MNGLSSQQLESVQRVITEPLVQTICAEMTLYHERLSGKVSEIGKLADAHEAKITELNRRVGSISRVVKLAKVISHAAMFVIGAFITNLIEWFLSRHARG